MIGYCPIEEEMPVRLPPPRVRGPPQSYGEEKRREDTETNYVVLFFIAGVLALAAMDSVKK
jgi:hypothetical protein